MFKGMPSSLLVQMPVFFFYFLVFRRATPSTVCGRFPPEQVPPGEFSPRPRVEVFVILYMSNEFKCKKMCFLFSVEGLKYQSERVHTVASKAHYSINPERLG